MELVFFDTDGAILKTFYSHDYSFPLVIPLHGDWVKIKDRQQEIEGKVTTINHTYDKTGAMSVHVMISLEESHS